MMELFQPWHLLILLFIGVPIFAALYAVPLWLIADKAGLQKWVAVLALFPPLGVIVLYYIALSKWHPKQG